MKNLFNFNKKGFTLVELLAVIVILALLIVITANTILPMLSDTKESGMVTYAERVMAKAATQYQADSISGTSEYGTISNGVAWYSIKLLMNSGDEYFGCVKYISSPSEDEKPYSIIMYNNSDKLKIEGISENGLVGRKIGDWINFEDSDVFTVANYDTGDECKAATYSTSDDLNTDAS